MRLLNRLTGRALPTVGVLLMTALAAGCDARGQESEATVQIPTVEVAQVLSESVTLWDAFNGRVVAPETVELRPRVSGYIDQVTFKEGELVREGDVLFTIDARPYQARERAARAELARVRSQLELTASEAERAEQLLNSRAISREEYEQRASALASARAQLDAASAALDSARLDLEYTEVRAPISGRAGRAQVTRGNLANADGTVLTTLVSVDPVYIYFESDQNSAHSGRELLKPQGSAVRVSLGGEPGFPHSGQLDFVDNQLNRHTGTLQYRAVLPNPDGHFRPGQFARVQVPTDAIDGAVLVDRKAVLTDQDRRYVYVVDADNQAARRDVRTGRQVDGLLVVEQGLSAGDRVVVNGLQQIAAAGAQINPLLVDMRRPGKEAPDAVLTAARPDSAARIN